jgi:hypothetical protein
MAMQTYVFLSKDNLPSLQTLQKAIIENGFDFQLPDEMNLSSDSPVFIEGKFEGLESCFDYLLEPYEDDDWEWSVDDKILINSSDYIAAFNTYSNAQEIVGMLATSSVLTKLTNSVMLSDSFEQELISSDNCIEFAKGIIASSRDQFSGPSKMRG